MLAPSPTASRSLSPSSIWLEAKRVRRPSTSHITKPLSPITMSSPLLTAGDGSALPARTAWFTRSAPRPARTMLRVLPPPLTITSPAPVEATVSVVMASVRTAWPLVGFVVNWKRPLSPKIRSAPIPLTIRSAPKPPNTTFSPSPASIVSAPPRPSSLVWKRL